MPPLSPYLKDAFEKFEQDFLASNLPEANSTAKYYKVEQPCFEDKLQELNSDFANICISPKLSGTSMGLLKELEHQARQNLCIINFTAIPLHRLLPLATLLWRSVSTVLRLPVKGLKARFRRVPILKNLPGVAMNMPVTILKY